MTRRRVRRLVLAVMVLGLIILLGPWPVASWWRRSGIVGDSEVGPTCPTERAGHPCPPGHVAVWLMVTRDGWPGLFAVARTHREGRFRIGLPPGRYTVNVVRPGGMGSPLPRLVTPTLHVTVRADTFTEAVVTFDSGIT